MAYEPWRCAAAAGGGQASSRTCIDACPCRGLPSGPLASPHAARRHGRGRRTTACRGLDKADRQANKQGWERVHRRDARRQAGDGRRGSPAHSLSLSLSAAHVKSSRAPSFFSSSPSSRCAARVVPPHHCRLLQRHHHTPFFFGDTRTARPLHSCMPCPLHLHSLSLSLSLTRSPACLLPLSISSPARVGAARVVSAVTGRSCRPRSCQAGLAAGGWWLTRRARSISSV